jgi:hypothetical protein
MPSQSLNEGAAAGKSSTVSCLSVALLLKDFLGGSFVGEEESTPLERCSLPESKTESEGSVNCSKEDGKF